MWKFRLNNTVTENIVKVLKTGKVDGNKVKKIDKIVRKYRMAGNGYRDEYINRKVRVRI